jgi:hypothetical protein
MRGRALLRFQPPRVANRATLCLDAAGVALCGVPSVPTARWVAQRTWEGNASFGCSGAESGLSRPALAMPGRPSAGGRRTAVAYENVPAFEWAARPSAVGALVVAVERRYAVDFGEQVKPRTQQQTGKGSVLNTRGQSGRVEQAPNPSFERTANGVRRSFAFADAVPPLSAAQVKR